MDDREAKAGGEAGPQPSLMDLGRLYEIVRERVRVGYGQPMALEEHTLTVLPTLEIIELIDLIQRTGSRMEVVLPTQTVETMHHHLTELWSIDALRGRVDTARGILATLTRPAPS